MIAWEVDRDGNGWGVRSSEGIFENESPLTREEALELFESLERMFGE